MMARGKNVRNCKKSTCWGLVGNKGQPEWGTDNWLESGWDEGEEIDKNQAVEDFLGF